MIVNAIFYGTKQVQRIYHSGEIVFEINPAEFHVIEDGKLIIQGAYSMTDLPQGLYLDCTPDVEWESPVQAGNVLYISQVYAATQNGNVLEVT